MRRRTRIEISTVTELSIRVPLVDLTPLAWCGTCRGWVPAVLPDIAKKMVSVNQQRILDWINAGQLHPVYLGGDNLICLNSLTGLRDIDVA